MALLENSTLKRLSSAIILFAGLTLVFLPGSTPGIAQTQGQWDSLFDRMIRIEADMRSLRANGGGQAGGGGASDQRLNAIEGQMNQLLGEVRSMNERLRRLELSKDRSGVAPSLNSNQTTHGGVPTQNYNTGDLPVATQDFNSYAEDNLVVDNGGSNYTGSLQQAAPPTNLGTISTPAPQGALPSYNESVEVATLDGQSVAGISSASGPQELYEQSYASMKKKQYSAAETGFRDFVSRYRGHGLAGNAQYWLGQSYYARGEYRQAAVEFLTGYKAFKQSKKAPSSLLKLGMSLRKLGKKDQACAALSQVSKQYPKAKSERKLASKEYKRAGC